jgi:putative salt-induced outer membrane protein YdiY
MTLKLTSLAVLAALSTTVQANDSVEKEKRSWDAAAEVGFNFTSGNTETSSLKTRLDVRHQIQKWNNQYIFDALRKKDKEQVSANKWLIAGKANYDLEQENTFLFIEGSREDDEFGAYDNYNKLAIGYGQRFFESETITVDADLGPGYVAFKKNTDGFEDKSPIIRASADLNWIISDNAAFSQTVIVDRAFGADDNTKTRLVSGLSARINGSLQMKLGLTITNNSVVDEGVEHTDTETSVTLVFAF